MIATKFDKNGVFWQESCLCGIGVAKVETEVGRLVKAIRITCRWEKGPEKAGRTPCRLLGGKVALRPSPRTGAASVFIVSPCRARQRRGIEPPGGVK